MAGYPKTARSQYGSDETRFSGCYCDTSILPGNFRGSGQVRSLRLPTEVRILGAGTRRGRYDPDRLYTLFPDFFYQLLARPGYPGGAGCPFERRAFGFLGRVDLAHLQCPFELRRLPHRYEHLYRED